MLLCAFIVNSRDNDSECSQIWHRCCWYYCSRATVLITGRRKRILVVFTAPRSYASSVLGILLLSVRLPLSRKISAFLIPSVQMAVALPKCKKNSTDSTLEMITLCSGEIWRGATKWRTVGWKTCCFSFVMLGKEWMRCTVRSMGKCTLGS